MNESHTALPNGGNDLYSDRTMREPRFTATRLSGIKSRVRSRTNSYVVLRDCLQAPSGDLREVRQFPATDETVDWRIVIEFFHELHRLRKRPRSPESNANHNIY